MIHVAAVGDIHYDRQSSGKLRSHLQKLKHTSDLFLIAGDLTQTGHVDEAKILASDLQDSPVPVIAVLGNHDYHQGQQEKISELLTFSGVHVLEKSFKTFSVRGFSVGIVGLKGFCGGFLGACAADFGEPEMKNFIQHTKQDSEALQKCLSMLNTDFKLVLLHYSPTSETLVGEKKEIYPFLGSYLFAEAIDAFDVDLVFHGHAHKGVEKGSTPGGIPVRNVALPVIRHAFNIYALHQKTLPKSNEQLR